MRQRLRRAVLVSGSRDHRVTASRLGESIIIQKLDELRPQLVIHGSQGRVETPKAGEKTYFGADRIASMWCQMSDRGAARHRPNELPMPARWDTYSKAAGPKRNARMVEVAAALVDCGWAVDVFAFPLPGSRGTWNLVKLAKQAGLSVAVCE